MARGIWNYPMGAAQLAVSEGIDADTAYQVISALGADISRDNFGRLYGQARLSADMVQPTQSLDLDSLPGAEYIQPRTTVTSTGYQYQLSVSAIDQESGETIAIPYSIRTDDLITPGEAIDAAIVSQTLRAPDYNLDVLDAQLTGIYQLSPDGD